MWRAYAGARFFNGTLEQTRKRFEQIVRHRAALAGLAQPGTGREETLDTYVSLVWDPDCEELWLLISDQGAGRRQVQVYAWRMRGMRVEAT